MKYYCATGDLSVELKFIDLISGDGGFADVWRARDELGRELAVKIVRAASIGVSDALQHARALARAKHPNVVTIHTIVKVNDPNGSGLVDAVVMEFLPGQTLGARLTGTPLSIEELASIGKGIISGLRHIHNAGMVHGDLHEHNAIVSEGEVKIIDLLHRYTLAMVNAEKRDEAVRRELRTLKVLLQQLIGHSEVDAQHSYAFTEEVRGEVTLDELGVAFENAVSSRIPSRLRLEHARTPLNLLDIITPGMHREHVRMLLGPPSAASDGRWLFRYQETQIEICYTEADAVQSIVIALCAGKKYYGSHPTAHTDQPIGELTLADLVSHGYNKIEDVEYFESLRTREIYIRSRWGPPGAWTYYAAGALEVFSGIGYLEPVEFQWDAENNRLITDPSQVTINWIALMANYSEHIPGFNWYIKS